MTKREWARHREAISEFFEIDGTRWIHGRIDAELARVEAKSLKCKKAGQASVQRRLSERPADAEQTPNHTDTDTSSSVSNDTGGKPPDLRKQVFDLGLSLVMQSGKTDKEARQMVGLWRKSKTDAEVLAGFMDCQAQAITDPLPWLQKRFQGARFVSKGGYEYRGDLQTILKECERRGDNDTYWSVKRAMKEQAA